MNKPLGYTAARRMIRTRCRQTVCRHCGLDIENFAPYRRGEWQDRGGNTRCNEGTRDHAPQRDERGRL